jgi:phosphopantothenoylcysteine decarboxylase/phosphopantothenate--cysteine ligase
MKGKKIVVGVTGGIAAFKAAQLVSTVRQSGAEVTVVMTREAQLFVTPLTFQALSQKKVVTDLFTLDRPDIVHVALADWPDLIIIAPATANIIAKIAAGLADDVLTCVVMSTRVPVLLAPAMDCGMWGSPIQQRNIETLRKAGFHIVGPQKGRLASGKTGMGRMVEVEGIIAAAQDILKSRKDAASPRRRRASGRQAP